MALNDNQTTSQQDEQAMADFATAFEEAAGPDEAEDRGEKAAQEEAGAKPNNAEAAEGLNLDAAVAESQAADGGQPAAAASKDTQEQQLPDPDPASQTDPATEAGDDAKKREARLKSWEGRLKAMARAKGLPEDPDDPAYAEKAAGSESEANAEALEKVADDAQANGNEALAQAAEEVADQVERAQITPEEARKILTEDFGAGFTDLLMAAMGGAGSQKHGEELESLRKSTSDEISQLKNAAQRNHYKTIERAHKDFREVAQSPEFKEFLSQNPAHQQVADSGDAFDAIELLDAFKAAQKTMPSQETGETTTDDLEDADVAVQATGGLRLPAEPAKDQSFENAWDEA